MSDPKPFESACATDDPSADPDLAAALDGLRATPRTLPTWLLYDARGSQLFEDITELEEYYPTRTELGILDAHAGEMACAIDQKPDDQIGTDEEADIELVELGAGSSDKVDRLLATGAVKRYVAVDVSPWALEQSLERVQARFPKVEAVALEANYVERVELPPADGLRRAAFFPGSTIGNFHPDEARAFLTRVRTALGPSGSLVLGTDMRKDPAVLSAAYNDARGVTADFNLNLLLRMNRTWGANFDLKKWRHLAHFNPLEGRIEMHLFAIAAQTIEVAGERFEFELGDSIWTESSYKFSPSGIVGLAADSGFEVERHWADPRDWFRVSLLRARD